MGAQQDGGLDQHSWRLAEIGALGALRPIPPEFTITLQFEEVRIHGKSACNRYFTTYHLDGPCLRFQPVGATRMMCHEPALALERDYFAALALVETYQLSADRLTFYSDQGKSLLLFRPAATS